MARKAKLNGSAEMLARAIQGIFEETQDHTVMLISESEKRLGGKIDKLGGRIGSVETKVENLDADVKGMRVQMNGMSKKLDRLQQQKSV